MAEPSELITRLNKALAARYEALNPDGVTLPQIYALAALVRSGPISQIKIVNASGIDKSTVQAMVTRMEDLGLVASIRSMGNGRARRTHITTAGRRALAHAIPSLEEAEASMVASLSEDDRRAFLSGLKVITLSMDKV